MPARPGRPRAQATSPPLHAGFEESFNEGKFDLLDDLVAADAVDHDPSSPAQMRGLRGPEVLKRTASMYRAAFPDVRVTVDDVIAAGDKVVLRWHSEGTHRGKLEGLAPSGARASVTGISIDRWQDGKVVEAWTEWDNLGLARRARRRAPGRQCRREDRHGSGTPGWLPRCAEQGHLLQP